MHKIRLEGDHQTLTFGVVQLVDAMQPGGAKVNISWGFWIKGGTRFIPRNFYSLNLFRGIFLEDILHGVTHFSNADCSNILFGISIERMHPSRLLERKS